MSKKMSQYEDSTIKGFYYLPNYLTINEEQYILNFLKNNKKWKNIGNKNSRKVIHYGYSYAYDRSGIKKNGRYPKIFYRTC